MKFSSVFVLCGVLCAVWVGADAAEPADLEAGLAAAKAAYQADSSPRNLAAVERLSAQLVAEYGLAGKSVRMDVNESEPNDDFGSADPLQTGLTGDYGIGDISPAGDIDWWSAPTPASNLAFVYVATSGSSTGTDSQLNVYDNDGTTLVEYDDDDGPGVSSVVAGAVVGPGPNLYYRVNEYGDNGEITPYNLFQAVIARTGFGSEVEPNNDFTTATPITTQGVEGDFPVGAVDPDWFSVVLTTGDVLAAILDANPDDAGFAGTKQLEIYDTDGTTLLADEDQNGTREAYAAGPITAAADGTYFILVTSDTENEDYRLVVVVNGGTIPVELQRFTAE
jgi:hypothetical protein